MTPKLGKYHAQKPILGRSTYFFMIVVLVSIAFFTSCVPTKHVPPGKLLLQNDPTLKGARSIDTEGIIKTKANRRVLIPKLYLSLYNLGTSLQKDSSRIKKILTKGPERKKTVQGISKFLRENIGEPPVLVNKPALSEDSLNLLNAYASNGFFDTQIQYDIDTLRKGKKANVSFIVDEGKAFHVKRYFIDIHDPTLKTIYKRGYHKGAIKAGDRMSYARMATERVRIANQMRDNGYFTFSPRLINFEIDTTADQAFRNDSISRLELQAIELAQDSSKKWMDLVLQIDTPPTQYRIREIFIEITSSNDTSTRALLENQAYYTDKRRLRGPELSDEQREALQLNEAKLGSDKEVTFLVSPDLIGRMQFNFIPDRIFLKEGDLYSQDKARLSLNRLQELAMLQYAIINYEVIDSLGVIDATVDIRMSPQYQLKGGLEVYNNNFNGSNFSPVIGASFGVRNKNTFGRAELLDLSVSGDVGLYPINENQQGFFWQVDGKVDLTVPRFLLPFPKKWLPKSYRDLGAYRPNTTISLSVLNQQLQQFDQFETGFDISYAWFNQRRSQQERTQVRFRVDITDISIKDNDFAEQVATLPDAARRTFIPRFSSPLTATYTNSDYGSSRFRNTSFFQVNLETGGHIQKLLEGLVNTDDNPDDNFLVLTNGGRPLAFGQYVKASIEQKLQIPFNPQSSLVLRGFLGSSIPIGKTVVTPPESRFYSGGTSSMRGWLSRTLGPGTFPLEDIQDPDAAVNLSSLFALGGEYILELNAEYRQDVWEYIEFAAFTDIGNVWFNNGAGVSEALGDTEGLATLSQGNLVLGWDAGIGIRFDFDFLIIRLDMAQQLYAPDLARNPVKRGWVVRSLRDIGGNRLQFNLGIGYPF
jgi:outer membrane protein assembly factor BamA